MRPNTHNCVICGRSLAGRHHTARVCTDKECISAHRHPPKMRTCRWCGREFRARDSRKDCGSPECMKTTIEAARKGDYERRKAYREAGEKVWRGNVTQLAPVARVVEPYAIHMAPPQRSSGLRMQDGLRDFAHDREMAFLFKGRTPVPMDNQLPVTADKVRPWREKNNASVQAAMRRKGRKTA